jgi:serine/threonine protein kinase
MEQLLELSHPHLMPIVGVIPPTKRCGPIILTRYSEIGSLETVLSAVRQNSPPPIWTDSVKLRVIVGLVSGLNYLHKKGIVHRELKPNDLIIESDGTVRICGYATSILEEDKYTKRTRFGGPTYMAPEHYDDEIGEKRIRDPKTDVFSFGLILYEILTG